MSYVHSVINRWIISSTHQISLQPSLFNNLCERSCSYSDYGYSEDYFECSKLETPID